MADRQREYISSLLAAFPQGSDYSCEMIAELWTEIAISHRKYWRYFILLTSIIETNSSLDALVRFKKAANGMISKLVDRIATLLDIDTRRATSLAYAVQYHAAGCLRTPADNEMFRKAEEIAGSCHQPIDVRADMREFILMCLRQYRWN